MQLTSHSPSLTISVASSKPYALFHYSVQASCIVTTTNFLAVYKAVNQNHTEQGVEVGGAWAELGGLLGRAAGLRTRCQSFTLQNTAEGGKGGRRGEVMFICSCAKQRIPEKKTKNKIAWK